MKMLSNIKNSELNDLLQKLVNSQSVDVQIQETILSLDELISTYKLVKEKYDHLSQDFQLFLYVISHDLNQPLRMVSSFTSLLQDRLKDTLSEKENTFMKYIIEGARDLSLMIEDIRKISRVKTEGAGFKEFSLQEMLPKIERNLRSKHEGTRFRLIYENLPTLIADKAQILSALTEIIDNGIVFNQKAISEIEISATETQDYTTIQVSDNGIGISEERYEDVFLPFRKFGDGVMNKGRGIGLALVKRIIQRHFGQINLSSQVGTGTCITIQFPKNVRNEWK